MDGVHDLGGKHGFGVVHREKDEPIFHHEWEARVFALVQAAGGIGAYRSVDRFRHAVERIDPVAYLSQGYYGRWLGGLETALVEAGILTQAEIQTVCARLGDDLKSLVAARPELNPDPQGDFPTQPGSERTVSKHRFSEGQVVRTSTLVKPGHTRLPAYARGKKGEITKLHQGWVFPDTNAHGQGEQPQFLYTVKFAGEDLWGGGDAAMQVHLDLFEAYLEAI